MIVTDSSSAAAAAKLTNVAWKLDFLLILSLTLLLLVQLTSSYIIMQAIHTMQELAKRSNTRKPQQQWTCIFCMEKVSYCLLLLSSALTIMHTYTYIGTGAG